MENFEGQVRHCLCLCGVWSETRKLRDSLSARPGSWRANGRKGAPAKGRGTDATYMTMSHKSHLSHRSHSWPHPAPVALSPVRPFARSLSWLLRRAESESAKQAFC